jgi:hypothetical protein
VQTLYEIMTKTDAPGVLMNSASARVAAAREILDRGWGKPPQFSAQTQGEFRRAIDMTDDELIAIATGAADPHGRAN